MLNVLDILDSNIVHLSMLGHEDINISMPVLGKDEQGNWNVITFSWNAVSKKQRNVPKPAHVLWTPLSGGQVVVKELPECTIPEVCIAKPMSTWTQRALARDLDEVIADYLATGTMPVYKYLFYLESMLTNYDPCYYPLFKVLTDENMLVEALVNIG